MKQSLQLALVVLMLPSALRAQVAVKPWKVNPYRNFFGCWSGTLESKTDKLHDVAVTIVDQPDKASMRWNYIYGHKGQKGYDTATKFVLFSSADSKIIMYYDREDHELLTAPGLAAFVQAGYGVLETKYTFTAHNYWHVGHEVASQATFILTPDALKYVRTETVKAAAKTTYNLQLARTPCALIP